LTFIEVYEFVYCVFISIKQLINRVNSFVSPCMQLRCVK